PCTPYRRGPRGGRSRPPASRPVSTLERWRPATTAQGRETSVGVIAEVRGLLPVEPLQRPGRLANEQILGQDLAVAHGDLARPRKRRRFGAVCLPRRTAVCSLRFERVAEDSYPARVRLFRPLPDHVGGPRADVVVHLLDFLVPEAVMGAPDVLEAGAAQSELPKQRLSQHTRSRGEGPVARQLSNLLPDVGHSCGRGADLVED